MKKFFITMLLTMVSTTLVLMKNPKATDQNINSFSISLNVKDITKSKAFYEQLGFEALEGAGGLDQGWLIMQQGVAKIGLFQGMFPKNTITLNPKDARSIYRQISENGIETTFSNGLDKAEGPASFALVDPDGNPILIDQH